MLTPHGYYGFGFAQERAGELELWGHNGAYRGFESRFLLEPERRFAFVGLANASESGAALDEILDEALERVLGTRRPRPPTVRVRPAELELLAGRYVQPELEVTLRPEDGGLRVEVERVDVTTGEVTSDPVARARPIGRRLFEVEKGARGPRFDFHPESGPPRFLRFESRLAKRLEPGE